MSDIISYSAVESKILEIRGEKVILDSDVAELYGVETMRVNEAVRRNPDKFPEGYIFTLSKEEKSEVIKIFDNLKGQQEVVKIFDHLKNKGEVVAICDHPDDTQEVVTICDHPNDKQEVIAKCDNLKVKFSPTLPKAFTEKGLYMLATILKSPIATQTTIAIVETFTKLRELSGVISQLPDVQDKEQKNGLLRKTGEILGDLLDNDALEVLRDETSFELNLALVNIKHTVKRGKRKQGES